ncbi:MAG: hypothetical protein GY851_06390 [bacterium]|nr:hypothetical protein [bacterium]
MREVVAGPHPVAEPGSGLTVEGQGRIVSCINLIPPTWACGDVMQIIDGIPWHYRQFGYEPALDLYDGPMGSAADVPDEATPHRVRPATHDDIPLMLTRYETEGRRGAFWIPRDETIIRCELDGTNPEHSKGIHAADQHRGSRFNVIHVRDGEETVLVAVCTPKS